MLNGNLTMTRDNTKLKKLWKDYNENINDQRVRSKYIDENIGRFDSPSFRREIINLAAILKTMSSKCRIFILLAIFKSAMFSQELEYILELSQPILHHHVRKLSRVDLIASKKSGKVNILTTTDLGEIFTSFLLDFTN